MPSRGVESHGGGGPHCGALKFCRWTHGGGSPQLSLCDEKSWNPLSTFLCLRPGDPLLPREQPRLSRPSRRLGTLLLRDLLLSERLARPSKLSFLDARAPPPLARSPLATPGDRVTRSGDRVTRSGERFTRPGDLVTAPPRGLPLPTPTPQMDESSSRFNATGERCLDGPGVGLPYDEPLDCDMLEDTERGIE